MLSINTNLSSNLVQRNLGKSTNALNQAIERLTTGYKINHSSDNAANYSIAQNYESELSSFNIASDNIASGMDLLATANDTLSLMEKLGTRLHALITQAQNGTYGESSLNAINAEAAAIISEINRLYTGAEYNGITLFKPGEKTPEMELPDWFYELNEQLDTSQYRGFISNPKTKDQSYIDTLEHVSELSGFTPYAEYQISTKEDLKKLAELVNSKKDTTNVTFYLGADIDLGGEEWTPIGNKSASNDYQFKGTFDGNGHVIKNFKISNSSRNHQGLFGYTSSSAKIKNLGVENAAVQGKDYVGLIVGFSDGTITNCYSKGTVKGNERTGGLAGNSAKEITDSYSISTVSARKYAGGLIGYATKAVTNCFTEGTVTTTGDYSGGLIGCTDGKIENCYSKSEARGTNIVAGLVGRTAGRVVNSYATGNATGNEFIGGVAAIVKKTSGSLSIDKILSLGQISGNDKSGSLLGGIENTSTNGAPYASISITNGYVLEQELNKIGGTYTTKTGNAPVPYDMTEWLNNITYLQEPEPQPTKNIISLQVGIYGNESSSISFDTTLEYDLSYILENGAQDKGAYDIINDFLQKISTKATSLGAISNRLDSALESVHTDITNITSSLSTIKDADIAKISSKYIQQQILQQAAATLLATANQSPSIALQLI